jgi:hypothetical protein
LKRLSIALLLGFLFVLTLPLLPSKASAADGDFSLQITPSPLVTTMHPGDKSVLELKVRNTGTDTENLKLETRGFTIDNNSGKVTLSDTPPPDITWVSFEPARFTVASGQLFTTKIHINLPTQTGFSYSLAVVISRQSETKSTSGGRLIKGSVADFMLINVDRPGATRKLDVAQFSIKKHIYEYLPAEIELRLKNTGNSIVQPYGNVFIQRGNSGKPISVLPVNDQRGYFLPGVQRSLDLQWNDGFPHYTTTTGTDGKTKRHLVWNWADTSKLRFGKYTAKLVAVYNDGGHDVPIAGEVSFWVIPWKLILGALVVVTLVLYALWSLVRKILRGVKKAAGKRTAPPKNPSSDASE